MSWEKRKPLTNTEKESIEKFHYINKHPSYKALGDFPTTSYGKD